VNDGKEWERGGCGCRAPTVNRTLSRGSTRSQIAYFSGWKNSLLYDPRISRSPDFRSRFCGKFCDLYASIYGSLVILTQSGHIEHRL